MNQLFPIFRFHRVSPLPPSEIARLRREVSIVELMKADGVELRPATGEKLHARCDLDGHENGNCTVVVTPSTNRFHCFGCGVSGDALDWVSLMEALTFAEAVERLQKIAQHPSPEMPRKQGPTLVAGRTSTTQTKV